jgi:hypothetical protein
MHRPNAESHRSGTTGEPDESNPSAGSGHATSEIECGERGDYGYQYGYRDEGVIVGT